VDAGSAQTLARGFIEVWGTRLYSDSRSCSAGLVVEFEGVAAGQDVLAGFQLEDVACREYQTTIPLIRAGESELQVGVDLAGPAHACPGAPAADASAGDAVTGQ
jgi:hypothetical protein